MADLAKTEKPITARRRGSDNRDFTLPGRRETEAPRLEVNAPIVGRNQSEAQRLASILGLAEDAGQAAVGLLEQGEARQRGRDRTAGALADAAGSVDEEQLANSRAYAQGYYTSGAQRTVIELGKKAQDAINERLFNEDDPATLEDINETLNELFSSVALNEDGSVRNFGDPLAARVMAQGLANIRAEILPKAAEYIRTKQNERLADNVAFNLVNGGMPEVFQPGAGTPIGVPASPIATIDPSFAAAFDAEFADASPAAAPATATSLVAPFEGFAAATPTDRIGSARPGGRTHNGEDFAVPVGTPLVAPMGGTVRVFANKAGGKQIIVTLDNGDKVGFAHLSDTSRVRDGQRVEAGQVIGLSGNTGQSTGPHVHMTVTSGGQKVSPSEYFAGRAGASPLADGATEDPNLRDKLFTPAAEVAPPVVDFEAIMAQRPPSISPGEWKAHMLPAIIIHAEEAGRPELLDGLWRSKRADGTPSFNPTEINTIRDAAERIRDERRIEADRLRKEKWEANGDLILTEIINDRAPSDATIIQMVNNRELDPAFGYSIIEQRENEREQAIRVAEADAKDAAARAERELDLELVTLQMERAAGLSPDASYEADLRRWRNGDFGTGKAGARRFRQARAAAAEGLKRVQESPEGQRYATLLDEAFPAFKPSAMGSSMLDRLAGPQSNLTRTQALTHYVSQLEAGKSPREAYESAIKTYGKPDDDALRARQRALQARQ